MKSNPLAWAIQLAAQVHRKQLDLSGEPYILHPISVMLEQDTERDRIVAVLHDVIEDVKPIKGQSLEVARFQLEEEIGNDYGRRVIDCVVNLSRLNKDEDYLTEYIPRILTCKTCTKVKLTDLKKNVDILRLNNLSDKDLQRLNMYHKAYRQLGRENDSIHD